MPKKEKPGHNGTELNIQWTKRYTYNTLTNKLKLEEMHDNRCLDYIKNHSRLEANKKCGRTSDSKSAIRIEIPDIGP